MNDVRAEIWNEDFITGMAERLAAGSVHLIVTSIPFEELFTYSGNVEDVGNNGSTIDIRAGRFALNMRFVAKQKLLAPRHVIGFELKESYHRAALVNVAKARELALPPVPEPCLFDLVSPLS